MSRELADQLIKFCNKNIEKCNIFLSQKNKNPKECIRQASEILCTTLPLLINIRPHLKKASVKLKGHQAFTLKKVEEELGDILISRDIIKHCKLRIESSENKFVQRRAAEEITGIVESIRFSSRDIKENINFKVFEKIQ